MDDSEVIVVGHSSARALANCLRDRACFDSVSYFSLENNCFENDMISHRLVTYLKARSTKQVLVVFFGFTRGVLDLKTKWESTKDEGGFVHIKGGITISDNEKFDLMLRFAVSLLRAKLPNQTVVFIPPYPTLFDRCCMNFEHFGENFDPALLNRTIMIFEEFLAQHAAVHVNQESTVLLLRSLTSELIHGGGYVSKKDGYHMSEAGLKLIADNICRNRVPLLHGEVGKCDLTADTKGLTILSRFSEFSDSIDPEKLPVFTCPPNLKRLEIAVDNSDTRSVRSIRSGKSCNSGQTRELNKKRKN